MRLDKTAYFFETKLVDTGRKDMFDEPIYEDVSVPTYPFQMEYEPYSADLAKRDYAINLVEVRYLMYVKSDERMEIDNEFVYESTRYKITYVMPYDNHCEVFIKDIGKYPEEEQY